MITSSALSSLQGKIVQVNGHIESFESDLDVGMRANVVAVELDSPDIYKITLDFSDFVEFNKRLEKPTYYDEHGQPTRRWSEATFYPENYVVEEFIGIHDKTSLPFDIME